jgi:DNA-binding MarR family transcriptional regulator
MVNRPAAADVVALVKSRALQPRDGVVLWALVANWEHGDNTTTACSAALAEQLGANRADVVRSLARIRRAGLLVRWQGRRSVGSRGIVNPLFVTAGGLGRRQEHQERFRSAL